MCYIWITFLRGYLKNVREKVLSRERPIGFFNSVLFTEGKIILNLGTAISSCRTLWEKGCIMGLGTYLIGLKPWVSLISNTKHIVEFMWPWTWSGVLTDITGKFMASAVCCFLSLSFSPSFLLSFPQALQLERPEVWVWYLTCGVHKFGRHLQFGFFRSTGAEEITLPRDCFQCWKQWLCC